MKIKVSVAIEKALVVRLDKIAAITQQSRSQIVERMIRDDIEGSEQMANLLANPQARAEMIKQFNNPEMMKIFAAAMGDKSSPAVSQKMVETVESLGQDLEKTKNKKGRNR
jgi:metal-responsive CopG/Arc/MetJ family transcriptional regulator